MALIGLMNGGDSSIEQGESTAPITRDLLGGCCGLDSKELDLDLKVPCGWEKRLDLKSGKVYLQRRETPNSTSTAATKSTANFHKLNFPHLAKQTTSLNLFDDAVLDLKLVSSSPPLTGSLSSSVCTLDKVKFALDRAEKETGVRKRSISISVSKSSSSSSSSSGPAVDFLQEEKSDVAGAATSVAVDCPNCLLYVMISMSNPKCPRCSRFVPVKSPLLAAVPAAVKRARLDLNISI